MFHEQRGNSVTSENPAAKDLHPKRKRTFYDLLAVTIVLALSEYATPSNSDVDTQWNLDGAGIRSRMLRRFGVG
jgi:hypothetical protein